MLCSLVRAGFIGQRVAPAHRRRVLSPRFGLLGSNVRASRKSAKNKANRKLHRPSCPLPPRSEATAPMAGVDGWAGRSWVAGRGLRAKGPHNYSAKVSPRFGRPAPEAQPRREASQDSAKTPGGPSQDSVKIVFKIRPAAAGGPTRRRAGPNSAEMPGGFGQDSVKISSRRGPDCPQDSAGRHRRPPPRREAGQDSAKTPAGLVRDSVPIVPEIRPAVAGRPAPTGGRPRLRPDSDGTRPRLGQDRLLVSAGRRRTPHPP